MYCNKHLHSNLKSKAPAKHPVTESHVCFAHKQVLHQKTFKLSKLICVILSYQFQNLNLNYLPQCCQRSFFNFLYEHLFMTTIFLKLFYQESNSIYTFLCYPISFIQHIYSVFVNRATEPRSKTNFLPCVMQIGFLDLYADVGAAIS